MMRRNTRFSRGYNIFEVLIAMAIMGVVMISIMTLFYMGRNNVYSGKQMTQAVAIGTQVLEDLAPYSKQQIYNGLFSIPNNATGTDLTITTPISRTYTNARIRSTDATIVTPPPADIQQGPPTPAAGNPPAPNMIVRWQNLIGPANERAKWKLTNGSVTVILTPTGDPTNSPQQFQSSVAMRINVIVRWTENGRQRELLLDTVKPY